MAEEHLETELIAPPDELPKVEGSDTFDEPPASEEEPDSRQRLWRAVGVIVLIVILVLIALLLRNCGGSGDDLSEGGNKVIVPVPRYKPVSGVVSVWVSDDAKIDTLMAGLGRRSEDVVSLGNGHYIISVGQGREQFAIDALKSRNGVFDAGLVYDQDNPVR